MKKMEELVMTMEKSSTKLKFLLTGRFGLSIFIFVLYKQEKIVIISFCLIYLSSDMICSALRGLPKPSAFLTRSSRHQHIHLPAFPRTQCLRCMSNHKYVFFSFLFPNSHKHAWSNFGISWHAADIVDSSLCCLCCSERYYI